MQDFLLFFCKNLIIRIIYYPISVKETATETKSAPAIITGAP